MISDYFKLAMKNLRKRKLRTWLTMLGIFISIATIFTLISLSLGLQNAVKEQFEILGADKFIIMSKAMNLGAFDIQKSLTEADVNVIKKISGVKDYSHAVIANGKIEFNKETKYMMVVGIPLEHLDVFTESGALELSEGRTIDENARGEVLLGDLFKNGNVFKKSVNAGEKITINGKDFKVKGIVKPVGNPQDDSNIYLSLEDVRTLFDIPERVDEVLVQVDNAENVQEVADRVEKKLRTFRGETEKTQTFTISTPEELLASFQTILLIITAFLSGIAAISLIVGAVGIANTMYTSVVERTKEIGIMKAIGAKNKDILWIFLIESGFLGLVGAGIGILIGMGASFSIVYFVTHYYATNLLQTAYPLWLIFGCLAFGFIIGTISGTLPALQASKTNVVDALRYE